jgi:SAM-dependent methyltransferase
LRHGGGPSLKSADGKPSFGTYHYSTPRGSEQLRNELRPIFIDVLRKLPFSKRQKIKILDIGCGLGFLSCLCAEFYPNAVVTGVDTFEHESLKRSSIEKARENARISGFSDRIRFQKGDITKADFRRDGFDLFVSNLVYHNLGRKRLKAYERLASWVPKDSFVVIGELFFFGREPDVRFLSHLFGRVKVVKTESVGGAYKLLVMSKPR